MSIGKLIKMSTDIFECLYDGIAIVDKDGTIVYVNDANERITDVKRSALLGKNVRDTVPHSHLPEVLASGNKLIGVKTEINGKQVISNIVPILTDGKLEGAISVFRDISEVLALNKKLEEANSTIEHLYKELNYYSGSDEGIVIGKSKAMENVMRLARKASAVTSTVLLQGESGTGKEVVARFIHKHSARADKPFIAVNCAAIPDSLLESELFGYEEGAFTGARKGGRPGVFELAHGGTIFLDEIGDMSIQLQAKILRVLHEREIMRVGGAGCRLVDVRVIAATNKNLLEMVGSNLFREDLYYRLEVIKIELPTLRERREDICLFADHAMHKIGERIGKVVKQISSRGLKALLRYDYPGNIRELENMIEMAIVTDDDGVIDIDDLPEGISMASRPVFGVPASGVNFSFDEIPTLEQMEALLLKQAAEKLRSKAAISRKLGISRSTLYRKLQQYGLLQDTED